MVSLDQGDGTRLRAGVNAAGLEGIPAALLTQPPCEGNCASTDLTLAPACDPERVPGSRASPWAHTAAGHSSADEWSFRSSGTPWQRQSTLRLHHLSGRGSFQPGALCGYTLPGRAKSSHAEG